MSCLILVSEKALLRKNKHNLGIQAASAPDQGLGAVSLAKLHGEDSSKRSVFFPRTPISPASRRGRDGFSQKCHNAHVFCHSLFKCAHFARNTIHVVAVCHILQHLMMTIDHGELRHFCDDPVCPDTVWKLSTKYSP